MKSSDLLWLAGRLGKVAKAGGELAGTSLRGAAQEVAERVRSDERVQTGTERLRTQAQEFSGQWQSRADEHLERVLERRQGALSPEAQRTLRQRRAEREARAEALRRRQDFLAQASTPEQRRVLGLVASRTPALGGQGEALRYTTLLDTLCPGGDAAAEMRVHRALWALAEARVLAVSPHGEIRATRVEQPRNQVLDSP